MSLLEGREKYKGNMVEDANKYYNENVNGIFEDSSVIDKKNSKIINDGSKWVYAEDNNEKIVEVINEMEKVVVKGMEYKAKVFDSDEDANKWLEKNKDWGVIKTENGKVYVAKKSDKGKKIEESVDISENVKNASQWL